MLPQRLKNKHTDVRLYTKKSFTYGKYFRNMRFSWALLHYDEILQLKSCFSPTIFAQKSTVIFMLRYTFDAASFPRSRANFASKAQSGGAWGVHTRAWERGCIWWQCGFCLECSWASCLGNSLNPHKTFVAFLTFRGITCVNQFRSSYIKSK